MAKGTWTEGPVYWRGFWIGWSIGFFGLYLAYLLVGKIR